MMRHANGGLEDVRGDGELPENFVSALTNLMP